MNQLLLINLKCLLLLKQIGHTKILQKDARARKDVARSLAIFSAFAEGVSLYSSFAVLYSFQMRNMLKGIGQQMKWSVRDESLHSKMGCQLFRHMCEEYEELKRIRFAQKLNMLPN